MGKTKRKTKKTVQKFKTESLAIAQKHVQTILVERLNVIKNKQKKRVKKHG